MKYLDLSTALLLASYLTSQVTATTTHETNRVLRAATKRADLQKRSTRIERRFESEVNYIDEQNKWSDKDTFASSVKVRSKKPILNLEDIEHHLQDVQCENGRMQLQFTSPSSAQDARAACLGGHGGTGGLVITSHESCNRDGERAVYKIDDISLPSQGVALDLAVTEALWQDAFDNIDITFGHTRYDHIYRRHSDFSRARKKRQDALDDALDVSTGVLIDLASQVLNYTFSAVDFLSGIDNVFVALPGMTVPDLPIEVGCRNCSTRGQIMLSQGAIQIDTKQLDFVPDLFEGEDDGKDMSSVITGGYVDLAITGLGARLDMFARPIESGSYEVALFPLPVLGFVIPGIGQAGASFEPRIAMEFDVNGEVDFTYGVDISVPDGAGIKVQLGDLTNTTFTGIEGATLNALPFSSNVAGDMSLSLAFTPRIPIGFEFSDQLSAQITVAMTLPRLDAKLSTNACSGHNTTNKTHPATALPPFKNTTTTSPILLEANITTNISIDLSLSLPLLPAPFDATSTSTPIFSTQLPLIKSCIRPLNGLLTLPSLTPDASMGLNKTNARVRCTKHEEEGKPCTCATATKTVYVPVETASYEEYAPYYPMSTSTPCTNTQTLRVTISTAPPALMTGIILIPGEKPCNASTGVAYTVPPVGSPSPAPSSTSLLSNTALTSSSTSVLPNTTPSSSPPPSSPITTTALGETKGFLSPSSSSSHTPTTPSTITGTTTSTSTDPPLFTGAASSLHLPISLSWTPETGKGWHILALGILGLGFVV